MPRKNKQTNPQKSAPQARQATAKTPKESKRDSEHVLLSKQSHDYAKAVADPFDSPPCGIPSYPSLPSLKIKTWSKGTFATGTTGFGFIAADPRGGVVNDIPVVIYSDSSYTHSHVRQTATGGGLKAYANAPYASAVISDLAGGVSFRIVAFGLRIRYIGTELERGGYKIGLVDPTNTSLVDRNIAAFEAETQAVRFSVDRKWTTVLYHPIRQAQIGFSDGMAGGVGGTVPDPDTMVAGDTQYWMGFAVQAASAGTSLQYEYEAYTIVEYQGSISTGQTVTLYDPVGHAAVDASLMNTKSLRPSQSSSAERVSSTLQTVSHYIKHGVSSYQAVREVASDVHKIIRPTTSSSSGSWWNTALNWIEALAPALALL